MASSPESVSIILQNPAFNMPWISVYSDSRRSLNASQIPRFEIGSSNIPNLSSIERMTSDIVSTSGSFRPIRITSVCVTNSYIKSETVAIPASFNLNKTLSGNPIPSICKAIRLLRSSSAMLLGMKRLMPKDSNLL